MLLSVLQFWTSLTEVVTSAPRTTQCLQNFLGLTTSTFKEIIISSSGIKFTRQSNKGLSTDTVARDRNCHILMVTFPWLLCYRYTLLYRINWRIDYVKQGLPYELVRLDQQDQDVPPFFTFFLSFSILKSFAFFFLGSWRLMQTTDKPVTYFKQWRSPYTSSKCTSYVHSNHS